MNNLEEMTESAKRLVRELLSKRPGKLASHAECPSAGGVYVIYEKEEVIYVGKARNLRRRVYTDHLSEEIAGTKSAFRRSLNSRHQIPFGPGMRSWIVENCCFACLPISDADMKGLVESLAIAVRRTPVLFNKQ
jgi:GIY-YIG catalytic domain-containing protein